MQTQTPSHTLSQSPSQCIAVLAMGGTIAGQAGADARPGHYRAGALDLATLWQQMPAPMHKLQQALLARGVDLQFHTVCAIDSKDLQWSHWRSLLRALGPLLTDSRVIGILITHGTDTAEETAWFLQAVLGQQLQKPIVLACAMRPADDPLADGPGNVCSSLDYLGNAREKVGSAGVWLQCAGLFPAQTAHKAWTDRDAAFMNLSPASAQGQGAATAPPVYAASRLVDLPDEQWPWVEIVTMTACADARAVTSWVQAGVQGIIVAGTGHGTLSTTLQSAFLAAQQAGVWVWRSSRCSFGSALASIDAQLQATPLPPLKARISMQLALLQQRGLL